MRKPALLGARSVTSWRSPPHKRLMGLTTLDPVADELWDTLGKVADGAGVAGAPVRLINRWRRRDAARNLLREIQGEFDSRWSDQPTRSDLYEQFSRLVVGPELWP